MTKFNGRRRVPALAMLAGTAAVLISSLVAGTANADTYYALASGERTVHGEGGLYVHMKSWGEHAIVSQSLARNPTSRVAWHTISAEADTNAPTGTDVQWNFGYIIGCQLDMTKLTTSGTVNGGLGLGESASPITVSPSGAITTPSSLSVAGQSNSLGATGNITVPLVPGQLRWVPYFRRLVTGGKAFITVKDIQVSVTGTFNTANPFSGSLGAPTEIPCGGHAEARSYSQINVKGDTRIQLGLYGQPFSLG